MIEQLAKEIKRLEEEEKEQDQQGPAEQKQPPAESSGAQVPKQTQKEEEKVPP